MDVPATPRRLAGTFTSTPSQSSRPIGVLLRCRLAMNYIRRHWYSLGLLFGAADVIWILSGHLNTVQVILLLNFVVLTVHQFEEYAWPGGEPWIINEVMMRRSGRPDRYPLNQNNAFFINVPLAYPFYVLPVFFLDVIWLGLAPTIFGFAQLAVHGIANNQKLKTIYNPGIAAVALGHVPLGIGYLVTVHTRPLDWVFGLLYMVLFMGLGMKVIGYKFLAAENSIFPFAPEEMERWDRRRHLARIQNGSSQQ
jgi:hypothetical protein